MDVFQGKLLSSQSYEQTSAPAVDAVRKARRGGKRDQSAGRMREQEEWQARIRKHDLFEKDVEITDIVREAMDMPLAAVLQRALRSALAAKVIGRHPEAGGVQVADGLEVFLDRFVAAVKKDDGAPGGQFWRKIA